MRSSFWVLGLQLSVPACANEAQVQVIDQARACDIWHRDADEDGFGDPDVGVVSCRVPDGHVLDDTDCDDTDPETHPAAEESCDDVDQDCDGTPDNNALDAVVWMVDADGDHFGDDATAVLACDAIPGTVRTGGDRDDADPAMGAEHRAR